MERRTRAELIAAATGAALWAVWALSPAFSDPCPIHAQEAAAMRFCGSITAFLFVFASIDMLPHALWDTKWAVEQRMLELERRMARAAAEMEAAEAEEEAPAEEWGGADEWAWD
jgi:hypothetical protein